MPFQLPTWDPPSANPEHPLFEARPRFLQTTERPSDVKKYTPKISEETAAEIRRLFQIKGMTKLAISQKLKISRSTVIRYLGTS